MNVMNKAKLMICVVLGAMALTACSVEDNGGSYNPTIEPNDTTVVIDNPNETVSDEPAYAPGQ